MIEGTVFDEPDFKNILNYCKEFAGEDYSEGIETVIKIAFSDLRNLPKLRYPKKIDGKVQPIPLKEYVFKWTEKYLKGYNSRPSVKIGKKSNTFSDPIVGLALSYRLPEIEENDLVKIVEGHSALMSIENLVGDLLEEYLSIKLTHKGWYCCWGSSIDAVDFCSTRGELLQVKNSDNSENSSSSRVRSGTEIQKWHRRKSTQLNTFCWDKLHKLIGADNVSEEDFRKFVNSTIKANPSCLFVDENNQFLK